MLKAASYFPDLLLASGAASISFGCWLAYPPAGYVVGGVLSVIAGLKMAKAG